MKNSLRAIKCGNYELKFDKTIIMGVLNVTPDSFSDGGFFFDAGKAIEHAKQMVKDGAQIIDVGGESTRPYSSAVSEKEELRRIKPVIEILLKEINVPISVDTCKPKVAEECLKLGAHMLNDITGLTNKKMLDVAKKYRVPVIIMHMKGKPKTMQKNPKYKNAVNEIKLFLKKRIISARRAGIKDVIIDPGIGFGKATEHNLQILKRLNEFKELKCPIMIGTSRKTFIGKINNTGADERLPGTIASVAIAIMNGANIVRVHDVRECRMAAEIADAVRCANG